MRRLVCRAHPRLRHARADPGGAGAGGRDLVAGVSTLIVLLVTLLPWAGLGLGLWWAAALLRTRFAWLLPPPRVAESR